MVADTAVIGGTAKCTARHLVAIRFIFFQKPGHSNRSGRCSRSQGRRNKNVVKPLPQPLITIGALSFRIICQTQRHTLEDTVTARCIEISHDHNTGYFLPRPFPIR